MWGRGFQFISFLEDILILNYIRYHTSYIFIFYSQLLCITNSVESRMLSQFTRIVRPIPIIIMVTSDPTGISLCGGNALVDPG